MNDDYRDMFAALDAAGVEYVVVGAHALAAHGILRATGDIDILVRPSPENARRVFQALVDFGAPVQSHGVHASDFEQPGAVYQLGVEPRRIDLLSSISGVTFDEVWADKLEIDTEGVRLFVIGREALIKNKLATGRDKDLLDVRALTSSER